jgi:hypothetical protein
MRLMRLMRLMRQMGPLRPMLRMLLVLQMLLVLVLPGPAFARQSDSFDQLPKLLRVGDVVEITGLTRFRTKGGLAELTPDSITVVANGRPVRIGASEVTEIRLLRRRQPGAERVADSGARCGGAPCMALTMAFAGTTSITRGVTRLFTRPKVVYRARW